MRTQGDVKAGATAAWVGWGLGGGEVLVCTHGHPDGFGERARGVFSRSGLGRETRSGNTRG